jgi:hypothetical protein
MRYRVMSYPPMGEPIYEGNDPVEAALAAKKHDPAGGEVWIEVRVTEGVTEEYFIVDGDLVDADGRPSRLEV